MAISSRTNRCDFVRTQIWPARIGFAADFHDTHHISTPRLGSNVMTASKPRRCLGNIALDVMLEV
jgi:hypothetical protein